MDDWATHKKLNEAQKIAQSKEASEREELERQIREEKEAQQYRTFKQWVRKQEQLEEKERLLKLLERRDLMQSRAQDDAQKKVEGEIDYRLWSQKKAEQKKEEFMMSSGDPSSLQNSHYSPLRRKI